MHGPGALNRARTEDVPASEPELAAAAAALASRDAPPTWPERALVREAPAPSPEFLANLRRDIACGGDPLGEAFCRLRTPEARRGHGAVYTPAPIVEAMIRWAADAGAPARIVDPGAGSGRFLLAAGKAFPDAGLIGIEIDPLAALLLRANAAVRGMAERLTLVVADYRAAALPEIDGQTLFLGNPPYVRHHDVAPEWKRWLSSTAAGFGFRARPARGTARPFLPQDVPALPRRRLRRVHHLLGMAGRELRRRPAQAARQRLRRRGAARHRARRHALRRDGDDGRDHLFPCREARPGDSLQGGVHARRIGRAGRRSDRLPGASRRGPALVAVSATGTTPAARLDGAGRGLPRPSRPGHRLQRRLDRRRLDRRTAGSGADPRRHPRPGAAGRRRGALPCRRIAPRDRAAVRSRRAR